MALEYIYKSKNESNLKEEEDESVVDLEGELINALDELKITWRRKKKIKEKLLWDKEGMYNSDNEEFFYQSKNFEESTKSEDNLAQQLEEKKNNCNKLEDDSNLLKQ